MRRAAVAVIMGGYAFWAIGSGIGHQPVIVDTSLTADTRPAMKDVSLTTVGRSTGKAASQPRTKTVKYDGYAVSVPASWPVYPGRWIRPGFAWTRGFVSHQRGCAATAAGPIRILGRCSFTRRCGISLGRGFTRDLCGRASDLQPMVSGVPLNEDMNLRLQYLAGMGLNSRQSAQIYRRILTYRQFPEDLLTGTGERMNALHTLLAGHTGRSKRCGTHGARPSSSLFCRSAQPLKWSVRWGRAQPLISLQPISVPAATPCRSPAG